MRRLLALLGVLFVSDRLIKNIIWFMPPQGRISGMLHPLLNRDISFSLPVPDGGYFFLIGIIVLIILYLCGVASGLYWRQRSDFFWWGLIIVGALSNLFDRLKLGAVLDYIDIGFWPVFNLSDLMISIGIFALLIREFRYWRRTQGH